MIRPRTSTGTLLAMLLIAAALLLRAAIPQGFMLESSAQGTTIAMCNSDMTMTIPFKAGHGPAKEQRGEPCAFAGHHAAATPPDGLAPLPLPQVAQAVWNTIRERAQSPSRLNPLPPATGPPAFA